MKAGRAKIGIYQKMRIKNLSGVSEVRLKKIDSFTLETSKNYIIRNILRNGRLRVKKNSFIVDILLKNLLFLFAFRRSYQIYFQSETNFWNYFHCSDSLVVWLD